MTEPRNTIGHGSENPETNRDRHRAFLAKRVEQTEELKRKLAEGNGPWRKQIAYSIHPVAWGQYIPQKILHFVYYRIVGNFFSLVGLLPGVRQRHTWTRGKTNTASWIPLAENIEVPDNVPLPLEVLDRVIETASRRVLYDTCLCRMAGDCKEYPADIGCLMLGDGALKKGPMGNVGHEVSVEEAKAHVRRAVSFGLIPIFAKARADSYLFGYRDTGRVLATCYCCDCCCITKALKPWDQAVLDDFHVRPEGAIIEVDEQLCDGCGKCVKKCYMGAISMANEKAVIGNRCRICSRCAAVCSKKAIRITLTDPDWVDKAYERLLQYCEFREGH